MYPGRAFRQVRVTRCSNSAEGATAHGRRRVRARADVGAAADRWPGHPAPVRRPWPAGQPDRRPRAPVADRRAYATARPIGQPRTSDVELFEPTLTCRFAV